VLHGIISQKIVLVITAAVRTSNPTHCIFNCIKWSTLTSSRGFIIFWLLPSVVLQVISQVQAWVALQVPLIMWYPQFLLGGHLHPQDLEQDLCQRSPVDSNTMGIQLRPIMHPSITTIATMGTAMAAMGQLHSRRQCPKQHTKPYLRL
jgi:hypothetical protein